MKNLREFKEWLKGISFPVYLCCIFLGISSWVDVSGMWVQLPILVNRLPEGWNLPSYLMIAMQVGQLGPLIFLIANRCSPNKIKEWPCIIGIIGIGALSCLLMSFFWHETITIGEESHSIALLVLAGSLAFVDTTSSVVYIGYMSIFKPQYMTGYYLGDGLSALIPGVVGLGQGVGGDPNCVNTSSVFYNETLGENVTTWSVVPQYNEPNFSVQVFFLFLFALLAVSLIAFCILHFAPFAKKEHVPNADDQNATPLDSDKKVIADGQEETNFDNNDLEKSKTQCARDDDGLNPKKTPFTPLQLTAIVILNCWMMFLAIGCYKSLESYAALPYGDRAYGLSVRLSKIADPLACFLSLFIPRVSVPKMIVLTLIGTVFFFYQLTLAILSPYPPLQDELIGEVLVVASAVLMIFIFTYTRVAIVIYVQERGGRRGLIWNGAIGQLGVFVGAIITFLVINVFNMLTRSYKCRS